jgi:hypothetical protein
MTMTIRFCLALCLTLIVAASWRTEASAQSAPVFLKAFYPLDEPRFHCVDIPGHKAKVNVTRPLSVHTCKEGIWHKDELFDPAALKKGHLRMPEYGLCVEATEASEGAELILKACGSSALQIWQHKNYRLVLMAHPDTCLTIGPEPSRPASAVKTHGPVADVGGVLGERLRPPTLAFRSTAEPVRRRDAFREIEFST